MDDLAEIKALLTTEPPVSEKVLRTARDSLLKETEQGKPHRRMGRSWPLMRKKRPRRFAIPAFLATCALVAGTWGVYAWSTRPLYKPEPLANQTGPAASFLLAAADGKAKHATNGKLWYLHTVRGQTVSVNSTNRSGNRYIIEVSQDEYTLTTIAPGGLGLGPHKGATGMDWDGEKVHVRPATPADKASWIADGRPNAQDLRVSPPEGNRGPFKTEGAELDFGVNEASKLSADPPKLRAWLLNYATKFDHKRLKNPDFYLFTNASSLLAEYPVSDRIRIATYRILASLKGVRMMTATDASGRTRQAVAMRQITPEYGIIEWQLFVDPETGRLLASQGTVIRPGTKNGTLTAGTRQFFELVTQAEWTNKNPKEILPESTWNKNLGPPSE